MNISITYLILEEYISNNRQKWINGDSNHA